MRIKIGKIKLNSKNDHIDEISYLQPLVKDITDPVVLKLFQDPNLGNILSILRKTNKPMTVDDLKRELDASGIGKSKKTIYRHLGVLERNQLVVSAGMRKFPYKGKRNSQTLYMRTAKIFFVNTKSEEVCEETEKQKNLYYTGIAKVLESHLNTRVDVECFRNNLNDLFSAKGELAQNLIRNADKNLADLVSQLSWKNIESLLDTVSLLLILLDEDSWYTKISQCFSNKKEK